MNTHSLAINFNYNLSNLSSDVNLPAIQKFPSYVWLTWKSNNLIALLSHQYNVSLVLPKLASKQLRGSTPLKRRNARIFNNPRTTRNGLYGSIFFRQGVNLTSKTPTSVNLSWTLLLMHSAKVWTSRFLLKQTSLLLLGPTVKPRHVRLNAGSFSVRNEERVARFRNVTIFNPSVPFKYTQSFPSVSKLEAFSRYIKLRALTLQTTPLGYLPKVTFRRRRKRLPKNFAYLFLGLRRAPNTSLNTPFHNLWRAFRKQAKRRFKFRGFTKILKTGTPSLTQVLPKWRRVIIPKLRTRSKTPQLRRWSKSLGRFRTPSLFTHFKKNYFPRDCHRDKILPVSLINSTSEARSPAKLKSHFLLKRHPKGFSALKPAPKSITGNNLRRSCWVMDPLRNKALKLIANRWTAAKPQSRFLRHVCLFSGSKKLVSLNQFRKTITYRYLGTQDLVRVIMLNKLYRYSKSHTMLGAPRLRKGKRRWFTYSNRRPYIPKRLYSSLRTHKTRSLVKKILTRPALLKARLHKHLSTYTDFYKYSNAVSASFNLRTINPTRTLRLPQHTGATISALTHNSTIRQTEHDRSVLTLKPLHSYLFTTSPFGFLGFIRSSSSKIIDLAQSTLDFSTDFKYTVFPDANMLKSSVFRRLNRQRFLLQSRMKLLHKFEIPSPSRRRRYEIFSTNPSSTNPTAFKVFPTLNPQLTVTRNSHFRNYLKSFHPATRRSPRIRRIRFKPGYYRIWRLARVSAREILGFTSRYQYRLTPKLQKLYFDVRSVDQTQLSLTLEFALLTSGLVPDHWSLKELLDSSNVYLNGVICTNARFRLFCSDFVQLLINLKFYIALRWLDGWSLQRKAKVSKIFYRKLKPLGTNRNIRRIRKLPHWFFDLQYCNTDIPKYFEVDYFTLSIFLIHDNIRLERWLPTRANQFNLLMVNMYNWKYIT